MPDPNTIPPIGKARHQALEAEFKGRWPEELNRPIDPRRLPLMYRLLMGLSSILLGTLMIVQVFVS